MGPKEQLLRSLVSSKGLNYVGTRGNLKSKVCFVGEAPGADEDQSGLPFVGYSGQELDRMALEAGFTPSDYWLTNPLKVRPPDNKLDRWDELKIPKEPFYDQFLEELEAHKPTIIIACGGTAAGFLCPQIIRHTKKGDELKLGLWRCSLLESPKLTWPHYVIPIYHPAFILREWSERVVGVLGISKAKEELDYFLKYGKIQPLPTRHILTEPPYDDVVAYLEECLLSPDPVSNDIELMYRKIPHTVGVAKSPTDAISFDLWAYEAQQSVRIWRLLDKVLRTKRQIGQNYLSFDTAWLEAIGFSINYDLVDDTMVKHHVLWPEFSHKLEFQTLQYTREPYYKDEGRLWRPKDGMRQLMLYNGKDCCVTYEASLREDEELAERNLNSFYEYEIKLARNFRRIEKRGIYVDTVRLERLRGFIQSELQKSCQSIEGLVGKRVAQSKDEADVLIKQMYEDAGGKAAKLKVKDFADKVINIGSPAQVLAVCQKLGMKIKSTAEEELFRAFAQSGHEFPKHTLRCRELLKVKGTYVEAKLRDSTLYCSYIPTGTAGGRRSSRADVFGYGTNMQNLAKYSDVGHMYRECLVARPGKVLVNCDQKSAEDWLVNGIIADVSGDFHGLNELRSGINRHKKLAAFLFAKPESEIDKGGGEYYIGKRTRHGGNYDMRAGTLSVVFAKEGYSIPEHACEYFLEKFHQLDPGIRGVYHRWVQEEMMRTRKLVSPLGRERYFLGLRPFSNNAEEFRVGYSFTPQTTVGDNTGMAINFLESKCDWSIMDDHDAVKLEVPDTDEDIWMAIQLLKEAFNRTIRFKNGLEFIIPIETEIGYNLREMKELKEFTRESVAKLAHELRETKSEQDLREYSLSGVAKVCNA